MPLPVPIEVYADGRIKIEHYAQYLADEHDRYLLINPQEVRRLQTSGHIKLRL